MFYTDLQKKVLKDLGYCKVHYENMYQKRKELGYCTKGNTFYDVHVASDAPSTEIKHIVLLHELGHIYYLHNEIDNNQELINIRNLFEELHKDYSLISTYGGPIQFLNIAMDLEINSTILTVSNIKEINKYFKICTPEAYDIPVYDDFRSYYRPLIEKIDDKDFTDKIKEMVQNMQNMQDLVNSPSPFSSKLPSEITAEMMKENYVSGNCKPQNSEVTASTVEEEFKDANCGDADTSRSTLVLEDRLDKQIQRFLTSILSNDCARVPDIMRIYNRGTRRSASNILYSSMRRKSQLNKSTLYIIIDVSGSMDATDLLTALSSVKDITGQLSPASKIVTWDTQKVQEFKITDIPKEITEGGGTCMHTAIKYAVEQGASDIVVYSDFYTDQESLLREAADCKANLYSIVVGDEYIRDLEMDAEKYLKLNKKYLLLK